MAIRDRLSRIVRKSFSSSSDRSDDSQPFRGASTPPVSSARLGKSTSRLAAKITSWRSNASQRASSAPAARNPAPKRSTRSGAGKPHPSQRPLTEQNMRHQEMLGTFTMKFGRSTRYSDGGGSSSSGISPCNSRPVSTEYGRASLASSDEWPSMRDGLASMSFTSPPRQVDRIAEEEGS